MIELLTSLDLQHVERILNHPSVYPWIALGDGEPIDAARLLDNPNVTVLMGEHGGQFYHRRAPGLFEGHSAFIHPEGRGRYAFNVTQATMAWIFAHTEAMEIVTRVPKGNIAAAALARMLGMHHDCTLPLGWMSKRRPIPAGLWSLSIQSWMSRAPKLIERGQWFHDRLEAEFERIGLHGDAHQDDETHDRYVGAAAELIFGGQPDKAVFLYNRVAMLAGWQPLAVAERSPLTIDIGLCQIVVGNDDFEAVRELQPCQ